MWWLFLYPLMRSLVELFRGDSERGFVTKVVYEPLNQFLGLPADSVTFLSTSQFISLAVVLCSGIALMVIRAKINARDAIES
jgi:prolipoprotein diacylglyceryltransferase